MELPVAEVFTVDSLWKTVVAAIVAGASVTLAFSVGLLGWIRATESRREERHGAARLWMTVAFIGFGMVTAGLVLGLLVMTDK